MQSVTALRTLSTLVEQALWFANQDDVSDGAAVCRRLHVLPARSHYWVDERGQVTPRGRQRGAPGQTKRWHAHLIAAIEALIVGEFEDEKRLGRQLRQPFVWQLITAADGELVATDAAPLTATLDAFAWVAPYVLAQPPWADRLRVCPVPTCERYYLRPEGRKQATCGREACVDQHRRERTRARVKAWRSKP